ncbi:phosphate acetyltransferase [Aphanothece hegewaldii CCALA 016]|uniref:Phosphate acetyltransferase n=1 Tax=Aphanothece hegewaldii CCALA 016 TaxID=2107694 RepID=A0A2T1LTV1_9CHRO|nr:phosphate acetyltransferase [Aphanothece hegewaldii]PSF34548.1 phosphate acetyltransferase [Aphanothece hegewaldii CCALA 016]
MAQSLFISTTEDNSGKALVALGILELILRKTTKVGFFRPIIPSGNGKRDDDIDLVINHFALKQTYDESFGLTSKQVNELLAYQNFDAILEKIITKFKQLEAKCDFILCEDADYLGESSAFEFELNTKIAKNLGCPILILGNAEGKSVEDAINLVRISYDAYQDEDCQVIGIILNKALLENVDDLKANLIKELHNSESIIGVIPQNNKLSNPRVKDIVEQLDAEVLYGHQRLNSLASHYLVAAMQMQHAITRIQENTLVITPGDRGDMIIGMLQAHQSTNYPNLAGIVLSTGYKPESAIASLIDGLPDVIPILSVSEDTYTTASLVHDVYSTITTEDEEKIALCIQMFAQAVDLEKLETQIRDIQFKGMTPKRFTYNLVQQAKAQKKHIVLPEGNEPRILQATAILLDQDIVKVTLIGKKEEIAQVINKEGIPLNVDNLNIINPEEYDKFEQYTNTLYELRKSKGLTLELAKDYAQDVSYFGTLMVYHGDADGMVSGAVHTTQHTIRPALQIVKTLPEFTIVSSVFLMCLEDRVLVYGDCAVNPNPTAEQLAEIAITSAETAKRFGVEPKIALLSYSSGASGKGEEVEKVRKATQIAKERRPDLKLEGPIQYDAAVDVAVAAQKMPGSEVAGQASVFIFPDLNTGNNTYKAVQRETGAIAIGPILQGLKKPVNDLSRGCTVPDIVNTVVITAIQAQS